MLRAYATCALLLTLAGCVSDPSPSADPGLAIPAMDPADDAQALPGIHTSAGFADVDAPAPADPPTTFDPHAATPSAVSPSERQTRIDGAGYVETRLELTAGMTLHWINVDDEVHSVVSDDGRFPGSGPVAQGSEFLATFPTPGEYAFHCRYHHFRGVVVVA